MLVLLTPPAQLDINGRSCLDVCADLPCEASPRAEPFEPKAALVPSNPHVGRDRRTRDEEEGVIG